MEHLSALAALLALAGTRPKRAQTPGTGGPEPHPTAGPLDGGASLLAGGVAYGLHQLRRRHKAA